MTAGLPKCNWCKEEPVACVTRSTVVELRPPYQGQTKMTRVVVIRACKGHRHKLPKEVEAA